MNSSPGNDCDSDFTRQRAAMVTQQLEARGIHESRVLEAIGSIPREFFVPEKLRAQAYDDRPLAIGHAQTISQPYTVAMMCEALMLNGAEKVLEIGTGSGYAACVLSKLARQVDTMERIPELAQIAEGRFRALGITNVRVTLGDGSLGLPEKAPFDAIVVTAGGPSLPTAYQKQLSEGGRIVMPIGPMHNQKMMRFVLERGVLAEEELGAFSFVRLIGADAWADD